MKNQKSRKILSVLLAVLMLLTALPMAASAADEITFDTDEDGAFLINTVDDLINLGISVDAGTTYYKKTFKLTSDLDLDGIDWDPIGSYYNAFEGNFYGQDHTISNLNVTKLATYMGLFAKLGTAERSGVIKDLTIKNVTVIGGETFGAGALAGDAYTGTISNVKVIGKIAIEQGYYVGGIAGGMSYARYENCLVDGSNDEGFDSYVRAFYPGGYANYVGGICGQYAEGAKGIDNCTAQNITLQSDDGYGIGGIVGVLQYSASISNCKVSNVNLVALRVDDDVADWVGTVAGKNYTNESKGLSKIINCEVDSYTAYVGDSTEPVEVPYIGTDKPSAGSNLLIGENVVYNENGKMVSGDFTILGSKVTDELEKLVAEDVVLPEVVDGKVTVVSPSVVAVIGNVGYESLQDAVDAASGATEIKLLNNFSDTVEIPANADITLDIAGCTFSGSITNNGTLTLVDSTALGEYSNTELTNNGTVSVVSGNFTKNSAPDTNYKDYLAACRIMNDKGAVVVEHNKSVVADTRVEPTCEVNGYEGDITCDCGETEETGKVLIALGHSFTNYVSNNDATCKADGTKTATCDNGCGVKDTIVDENSKVAHTLGEWTVVKEASCVSVGEKTATCSVCNEEVTEDIPIDSTKHTDDDHDGICDDCLEKVEVNCDCYCHKTGKLSKVIWKIVRIFWKLFGGNNLRYCECGRAHW